jgi:pimeloyl-ACP methyl ester carboxylesterase
MAEYRERRYLAEDGLSLYYREYGDPLSPARPVVCLPGLTRNSRDFHRVASRLAGSRRVICPDYRGRGFSEHDPDPSNYHPMVHVNDIRHLLAVAGLHRAIFVGTSFGGFLIMGLALAAPSAIAAAVLNDVGPEVTKSGLKRIMDYIGRDHPQPDWPTAVREMKRMFPNLSFKTDEEWLAGAKGTWREAEDGVLRFNWDLRLAGTVAEARHDFDPWALFRALRGIPVLAFRGEKSDVFSSEILERMQLEHPALTAVTVPDVGHPLSLSEPKAVEALDEFLDHSG